MSPHSKLFTHLKERCDQLISKYIDPIISSEQDALNAGAPVPDPDYDSIASFRLLVHAELEGYFECRAKEELDSLDAAFKLHRAVTAPFASLIFFYMWKEATKVQWEPREGKDERAVRLQQRSEFKRLAQEALGWGRQFISANNGIKENSIQTMSGIMGLFSDDLDDVLIQELNQFGKKRGDVAHDSWTRNTRTFDSAIIEKNRVVEILNLIEKAYETQGSFAPRKSKLETLKQIIWGHLLRIIRIVCKPLDRALMKRGNAGIRLSLLLRRQSTQSK